MFRFSQGIFKLCFTNNDTFKFKVDLQEMNFCNILFMHISIIHMDWGPISRTFNWILVPNLGASWAMHKRYFAERWVSLIPLIAHNIMCLSQRLWDISYKIGALWAMCKMSFDEIKPDTCHSPQQFTLVKHLKEASVSKMGYQNW